jgi:anti-sigma B factor antagonist
MALLEISHTNGTVVLSGELDLATADALTSSIGQVDGDGPLVLDCSQLTFMDSSGLRVLLGVVRGRTPGSGVVILKPRPSVKRVLDISLPDGIPGLEVRT